ncbi:LysE family transporter [Thalassococcus sp. S3]|uniref:LysE family transporter n=1 Tax=Thalassococcus sp. S3 TaxID=2017482 RepID=UPI0010244C4A|nr:LysE family transporter [Thalassococcus sp. S3]QBF32040.1 hypothetical protein CFI11_12520 [Thalassococcus sp. S3]
MEEFGALNDHTLLGLLLTGFALGWSVAWPPGPVNMEIVRRGSLSGFWAGYSLCLGGVTGDALWAIAVFAGTAVIVTQLLDTGILTFASLAILLLLALHYFWTSFADFRAWWRGSMIVTADGLATTRGGFGLGLLLTLTSPWSIAFWLGVSGLVDLSDGPGLNIALLIVSIMVGAAAWGLLLCLAVSPFKTVLRRRSWHAVAKLLTGLFLAWIVAMRVTSL